eukprot:1246511-Rhodomonas_salina.1
MAGEEEQLRRRRNERKPGSEEERGHTSRGWHVVGASAVVAGVAVNTQLGCKEELCQELTWRRRE